MKIFILYIKEFEKIVRLSFFCKTKSLFQIEKLKNWHKKIASQQQGQAFLEFVLLLASIVILSSVVLRFTSKTYRVLWKQTVQTITGKAMEFR